MTRRRERQGTVAAAAAASAGAAKRAAAAGAAVLLSLALALGAVNAPAAADELSDRKAALEAEQQKVQEQYEYLDQDIAKTVAQLNIYQNQELPAAQAVLTEAEGRVSTASAKVGALTDRVALAQESRNTIAAQIEEDRQALDETQKVIGQIASQAYKSGGVPSSLTLLLGAEGAESLTDSMGMAGQALRGQNAAVERLTQQAATNVNSEARLAAVEEEISSLKAQAQEALESEQAARDEAAEEKSKVDSLIASAESLNNELEAKKPVIQAKLASIQSEQAAVQAEIAERQRILLEEARRAEEARIAEANRRAAEEAAQNNQPPPPPQTVQPTNPSAFGLRYPVSAPLSSGFGWRATPVGTIDFNGSGGYLHSGLDFGARCGTPIYAAAAGEVWRSDTGGGEMIGTGNRIVLNHGVIGTSALATNYYHLSSRLVNAGQWVNAGQLIGYVGQTGNSSGCHLHFETMLNGQLVNPMGLL
ncbi:MULTISPECIES: M23 family metallopeptidase [Arthrobacter]|uniref:Peptidoglycan DD-metalloendopeptidase family protein n=1 Tax=Arthrobacter caoxuetaonis TaxID=2886935 RepID=A0A9X1MB98_9MICC|nr:MULTISPECIES: M23 family metallopeptidase [Arthrobacter]MCC3280933.1 peptidoglycan DD-metalloendopeptidase family protein [Arthrobacter caoxuetaonis]MCC3296814.1 peptidoglycan DD-metalloendopeptidase family protein [Arthrobacter caoxuetaonis]MCC9192903.1 peptidoglycan DD-metalloendopeptidase family protein [Arthrobacter sp. zg-Y916]USQ56368.1 peptidoglycan DD-metalloendopeptidase family protein [Arthrobacter caoxuetaonis]